MRRKLQTLLLLLPLLAGGCMTHELWTDNPLDAWNVPATPANLQVYNAEARKDFLVVYDEHSERHDSIQPRAYFLNQNSARIADRRAPQFVSPNLTTNFTALPFCHGSTPQGSNAPAPPFVVVSTNSTDSFTLYVKDRDPEEHHLPVYSDGIGNYERVALTPFAVVADVSIVGGAIGLLWLYLDAPGLCYVGNN